MNNYTPVYDELFADNRFVDLILKTGNRHIAIGMCIDAYRLAHRYWINENSLVPEAAFNGCNLGLLLEVNLAVKRENGIYVRGTQRIANTRLDKINQKSIVASEAGKRSAEVRRLRHGTAIPINAPYNSPKKSNKNRTKVEPKSNESNEIELSKDKISKDKNNTLATHKFVAKYCELYKTLFNKDYKVTPKDAGQAKVICSGLGVDNAISYIRGYLTLSDKYLIDNCYPMCLMYNNINKLTQGSNNVKVYVS